MSEEVYRLMGPNNNRMITVHPSPVRELAQIDYATAETLKKHGWRRYSGPAEAEDGWVKPGSDPNLKQHRLGAR